MHPLSRGAPRPTTVGAIRRLFDDPTVPWRAHEGPLRVGSRGSTVITVTVRNRRILVIPGRSGEGPLIAPTTALALGSGNRSRLRAVDPKEFASSSSNATIRRLHSEAALTVLRRLHLRNKPMVILPMKLRGLAR